MGKVLFNVFLLVIGLIIYDQGIKPYNAAKNEEEAILKAAGIVDETTYTNRNKARKLFEKQCSKGYWENNQYEFGCVSGSFIPFLN